MDETVCVTVVQGSLRGRKVNSKHGATYYSFQGIPYAKPPVASLRFKPPEPAENWEGIRDALVEGPVCPQFDIVHENKYIGEEDCLFINVYTPQLPNDTDKHLVLPVMVYIHGGGFFCGHGNSDLYGPDYLITQNIILVTMNYRLGAFGFLSTGDSVVPGNNGLKDQVMALHWVQQNIQQFGGDNKNVTIFGESAGAGSVHLLTLSPMSRGLFHKAIAQSGSALNPWACEQTSVARHKAFRFGETLGIKTEDSKELVEFLNKFSPRELVEKTNDSIPEEEKHPLPLCFLPTTDIASEVEVFMPDRPENIISQGKYHKVPFMTGVTSNEGKFVLQDVTTNHSYYNKFRIPIPNDLLVSGNKQKYDEALQRVEQFYLGSKPISRETWQEYADIYSDLWFIYGKMRSIKLQLSTSREPIYFYQFAFDRNPRYPPGESVPHNLPGASHGDDVFYIFPIGYTEKHDEASIVTIKRMVKMWTNFAKTGNPTPAEDSLLGVMWEPVTTKSEIKYLNIDEELTMKKDLATERVEFLKNLYAWLYQEK